MSLSPVANLRKNGALMLKVALLGYGSNRFFDESNGIISNVVTKTFTIFLSLFYMVYGS